MQVQDLMTHDVTTINPEESLQQAARTMAALDVGVLPVSENDRLVGMITDRDIAVRGMAEGKGPKDKVRSVMTPDVKYCFLDQEVDEIAANMADIQVRRLPVLDHDKLGAEAGAPGGGSAGFRVPSRSRQRRTAGDRPKPRYPLRLRPRLGPGLLFQRPGCGSRPSAPTLSPLSANRANPRRADRPG